MSKNHPLSFQEWVTWLETRHTMPLIAPGLERTLQALKHAELYGKNSTAHTIHIAGTNGKGTTAKALSHLVDATGESVGLYTSPHLVTTRERIQVNGQMISENEFVDLCIKHLDTIEKFHLTHFETLTLFALDYFLNVKKTKWMIFEIGLGGTWDATNAIPHGTSVITTLGYDHMHILGNSLLEIAKNKFGIIQKNNLVIHQNYTPEINSLLQNTVKINQAEAFVVQPLAYKVEKQRVPKYSLLLDNQQIPISLPGKRAIENLSTAITVFLELGFSEKQLNSLKTLSWPARMSPLQLPENACPTYASGDHNIQGIESLCEILNFSDYRKIKIILGLSKNRSHAPFIEKLTQLRDCEVIFTQPEYNGVDTDPLKYKPYFKSPMDALAYALEITEREDLIVITGSLYLCGEIMRTKSF